MSQSISERQNEPRQLEYLAAQRQVYSDAKKWLVAEVVVSALLPVIAAGAVYWRPEAEAMGALAGIVGLLVNELALERLQEEGKLQAARIQEAFDCAVLSLPAREAFTGPVPAVELVVTAARKYAARQQDDTGLPNWYTREVSQLPLPRGRLLCQRENCVWDVAQGRKYASWVLGLTLTFSVGLLLIGILLRLDLGAMVSGVGVPLAPALVWGIREYLRHRTACDAADRLRERLERLWRQSLDGSIGDAELANESRDVQDAVFDHRRHRPLVFDWLYERFKSEQAPATREGTLRLIELARAPDTLAMWVGPRDDAHPPQ